MEGYKLIFTSQKSLDSIQDMFDRAFKRVNTFEDFRTELVEGKEKRAGTELKDSIDLYLWLVRSPSHMLKSFDREDLEDLYKLVKAKYEVNKTSGKLGFDIMGDLKTMFEPHVEDKIYMFVEKKYPLAPLTLLMMLEKKLIIDYESKMAYQLLKFIIK
ncbi:hypothetical protein Tco_0831713 [Tanacetum coccineum]